MATQVDGAVVDLQWLVDLMAQGECSLTIVSYRTGEVEASLSVAHSIQGPLELETTQAGGALAALQVLGNEVSRGR